MPDGAEQVGGLLTVAVGHPHTGAVVVADRAALVAGEHRQGGVLATGGVLAAQVVLEAAGCRALAHHLGLRPARRSSSMAAVY